MNSDLLRLNQLAADKISLMAECEHARRRLQATIEQSRDIREMLNIPKHGMAAKAEFSHHLPAIVSAAGEW